MFSFAVSNARTVCLAIFCNDWSPPSARVLRLPWSEQRLLGSPQVKSLVRLLEVEPALWRCEVSLRPGWCEYLFLVDAAWMFDPTAAEKCPDGSGDFSSARWIESIAHPGTLP